MVCPEDIEQVTVEAEASERSCYTKPAGGSPVRVSADAPGSRPQSGIERSQAERGVKSLEKREQNRGPQHEVKFAASSDFHPKGVRESRADHITAKATDMILESERVMDFSGVLNAGRGDGFVRNRRGPTRQPSQAKTAGIRPEAENQRSREGVRGVHSTDEGGQDKPLEGRNPALVRRKEEVSVRAWPKRPNHPEEKVRELQRTLYRCAKQSKTRRFHALYDRISRSDVLLEAWKRVQKNRGAAGIDRQTIAAIEEDGVEEFLHRLGCELKEGTYRPLPVRRWYIPKSDGKSRPLGIPAVRDRVLQMATKLVVEPIFEADFLGNSYGFRPKRNATGALEAIREAGNRGYNFVVDADIRAYFDTINQDRLMAMVGERVSDRRVQKLIRKWLEAGVMEDGQVKETMAGTPQGGVLSPLLSNIYLHALDEEWERKYKTLGILIRYADDFVIMCRNESQAREGLRRVGEILKRLGLELHPEKTKIVDLRHGHEGFEFLGCTIRKKRSILRNPRLSFVQRWPSPKAMKRVRAKIHAMTEACRSGIKDVEHLIHMLNPVLRGWCNYFRTGNADRKFNQIDSYVFRRITRWLNRRGGQRSHFLVKKWSSERLFGMGLYRLQGTVCYPVYATSANTIVKPCAGKPQARFERRNWKQVRP